MMLFNRVFFLIFFLVGFFSNAMGQEPKVLTIDREILKYNKQLFEQKDVTTLKALSFLSTEANRALKDAPFSVTYKTTPPPSGDKHDFYSFSTYSWGEESKSDGNIKYMRIDGKVNTRMVKSIPDREGLETVCLDVYKLGLAYYFTNNENYAKKAKELITVFFLDDATKMNPNFNYSQYIPNKPSSGGATVSGSFFLKLIDGVQLLQGSQSWTNADHQSLQKWFASLLNWMQSDSKAKREKNSPNNIGTYYTAQVVTYALFIGNTGLAKKLFQEQAYMRVNSQIDKNGDLPLELKRAKPYNYLVFNLQAFMRLVNLGKNLDFDLWSYQSKDGGSIKRAFDKLKSSASKGGDVRIGRENIGSKRILEFTSRYQNLNGGSSSERQLKTAVAPKNNKYLNNKNYAEFLTLTKLN